MRTRYQIFVLLAFTLISLAQKKTLDQLKAETEKAGGAQQAKAYAELAERLVDVADQEFSNGESVKGQATVQEILEDATKAHDLAVSSRKKLKEIEILLRQTQRRLENVRRTLAAEDRPELEKVEKRLADYRQDLLNAMFSPRKEEKK
jgi:hypothetical protein